jgi:hypothetical protein
MAGGIAGEVVLLLVHGNMYRAEDVRENWTAHNEELLQQTRSGQLTTT